MTFQGTVEAGMGWAKSYGYPTANVRIPDDLEVTPGTWSANVYVGDTAYQAAAYCASHRGFPLCEVHLFDFSDTLYDQRIRIELLSHLSPVTPFKGAVEMRKKVQEDILLTRNYFKTT